MSYHVVVKILHDPWKDDNGRWNSGSMRDFFRTEGLREDDARLVHAALHKRFDDKRVNPDCDSMRYVVSLELQYNPAPQIERIPYTAQYGAWTEAEMQAYRETRKTKEGGSIEETDRFVVEALLEGPEGQPGPTWYFGDHGLGGFEDAWRFEDQKQAERLADLHRKYVTGKVRVINLREREREGED